MVSLMVVDSFPSHCVHVQDEVVHVQDETVHVQDETVRVQDEIDLDEVDVQDEIDVQVSIVTLLLEPDTRCPSKLSSCYAAAADLVPSVVQLESVVGNTVAGWTSMTVDWTSMTVYWTSMTVDWKSIVVH